MANERDFIDELIDFSEDWQAVRSPLAKVEGALTGTAKVYNPDAYKEKPRVNSIFCLRVAAGGRPEVCSRCLDVCPVDAIEIGEKTVKIKDNCRKCGLCIAECPTEVFLGQKTMAKTLYDKIVRIASAYETCIVTCTRALGREPLDNEVLLPCVGAIPEELWFSLLVEFDNIEVYLPAGICDKCQTVTGEMYLSEQISRGEERSGASVGIKMDEAELTHEQKRSYKRAQFLENAARTGANLVANSNVTLMGARAIAQKIQKHSNQIYEMQRSLERTVGDKTTGQRRRILTQRRKLMLTTLQRYPGFARRFEDLLVPVCDRSLCTACEKCLPACPTHAIDIDRAGRIYVEAAYCVNCGACAKVCPEDALTMEPVNVLDLVVRDEEAEAKERAQKAQAAKAKEAAEAAKAKLKAGLDYIESLAEKE